MTMVCDRCGETYTLEEWNKWNKMNGKIEANNWRERRVEYSSLPLLHGKAERLAERRTGTTSKMDL